MNFRLFFISILFLVFIGCSKTTVVLLDSGNNESAILVSNEKGETKLDKVGTYITVVEKDKAIAEISHMSKEEIEEKFSTVLKMTPLKPLSYILYFETQTNLTEESKKVFNDALQSIEERSPCVVDVVGHTDTLGSHAINVKVSLKRAQFIQKLIEAKTDKATLVAKGYGEEDLLVATPDNTVEAKNRNVEIFIK